MRGLCYWHSAALTCHRHVLEHEWFTAVTQEQHILLKHEPLSPMSVGTTVLDPGSHPSRDLLPFGKGKGRTSIDTFRLKLGDLKRLGDVTSL